MSMRDHPKSTQTKTRPVYEVVGDQKERDDEPDAQAAMRVIEVIQLSVDSEARWVRKSSQLP